MTNALAANRCHDVYMGMVSSKRPSNNRLVYTNLANRPQPKKGNNMSKIAVAYWGALLLSAIVFGTDNGHDLDAGIDGELRSNGSLIEVLAPAKPAQAAVLAQAQLEQVLVTPQAFNSLRSDTFVILPYANTSRFNLYQEYIFRTLDGRQAKVAVVGIATNVHIEVIVTR